MQGNAFHKRLIRGLCRKQRCPGNGSARVEVIETHISTVLLVGEYAYKIKKPLDLGFIDYSTLERRHHFCQEEIRLNGRLAPQIYLDVVAISGSPDVPRIEGGGDAIEYAVRMRRFSQQGLLADHPELIDEPLVEQVASRLAAFHDQIAIAPPSSPYGEADAVMAPMRGNFTKVRELLDEPAALERIERLEAWTQQRHDALRGQLVARKADGMIRECHGDLHLGNMVQVKGEVVIFDGIEFNPDLRWIDTISELAFLLMDLDERGLHARSNQLLNSYLELSGDYPGCRLLRFYQVYRAMVRAKVVLIRLAQSDVSSQQRDDCLQAFDIYLSQAERYTLAPTPALIITHGLSGSGKSSQTRGCLEALPAIRLRSDVERKRLAGLQAGQRSDSTLQGGIYSAAYGKATYDHLRRQALVLLEAGFSVIVDATFLKRRQRELFHSLSQVLQLPFLILNFQLPEDTLRRRLRQRDLTASDASEADTKVLEQQMKQVEPLTPDEEGQMLTIGSEPISLPRLRQLIAKP